MLEQVNNNLTFLAHFVASGAGATGLTVTCTVYKGSDGSAVVTAQAATEIGGGLYKYTLSAPSTEDNYVAVFNTAGTADQTDIPSLWVVGKAGIETLNHSGGQEDLYDEIQIGQVIGNYNQSLLNSIEGKLDVVDANVDTIVSYVTTAVITVNRVVSDGGDIEIVRGDTYESADSRALEWSGTTWPVLTGGAILLTVRNDKDRIVLAKAGSVVDADTARVELTAAETDVMLGTHKYDLEATLASGNVVTLVRDVFRVVEDQSR
jgi:hypothetical protein